MKPVVVFSVLGLLGIAGPALAEGACTRPTAPATPDGATVTMEQLVAAKAEVGAFMTASDTYQTCVIDSLAAARKDAKANKKKIDPAVVKEADANISANQSDKVKVGDAFNGAVKAYKAAHPS
jgi:hypothetical protein